MLGLEPARSALDRIRESAARLQRRGRDSLISCVFAPCLDNSPTCLGAKRLLVKSMSRGGGG